MKYTKKLAYFVSKLEINDIPSDVINKMKIVILDTIGCGLLGTNTLWGKIMKQYVIDRGGMPEATLWSCDFKAPVENVALGLGTFIHAFDYDDYHNAKVHPGSVIIPAAICAAEKVGAGGKQFLSSVIAGYEVMVRVSLATGPNSSRLKGWHLTGTCGTFGAAAAVSKLNNFSQEQTANALGLAGTQSAGLWAFNADGAMSKRLHPGRSAQSGLLAVELVKRGFTGPTYILEAGDGGFCQATSDEYDFNRLIEGLGEVYVSPEVNIKPYPCCGSVHSAIDAVKQIIKSHSFNIEDIEQVNVYGSEVVGVQTGFDYVPTTVLNAQMSLKYCVAVALIEGDVFVNNFDEDYIKNHEVVDLTKRIFFKVDPELDLLYPKKFCNAVEICLVNGEKYYARVDDPIGSMNKPLSNDQVIEKFFNLSKLCGKEIAVSRIIENVINIEELSDINKLTDLLF